MKKTLIFVAILSLMAIDSTTTYVKAIDSNSPHVDSKFQFPNHRWGNVRHTIQVHIPRDSSFLEDLQIDIPKNLEVQISKIEITDRDRPIDLRISRQGQRLNIKFDRLIVTDTQLRINFNGVQRNLGGQLSVYHLYGKTVGGSSNYIGEAYFYQ
jgi:hypothetical protein